MNTENDNIDLSMLDGKTKLEMPSLQDYVNENRKDMNNKRYVVVSTNNNPDYLFFAPYIEAAWNKFGWNLCVMITDDVKKQDLKLFNPQSVVIKLPIIHGLRGSSIAQAGRLYAANHFPSDTLLMTSDMDLLPLSNYWNPNENDITVYGYDLTWRSFYPMGYLAMSCIKWQQYMNLTGSTFSDMERDAKAEEKKSPYSDDWGTYWDWDWSMITDRLKPHEKLITFIDRGQIDIAGATLAKGRIDRHNISVTRNQPEPMVDFHCENNNVMHESKLNPFLEIFDKYINEPNQTT